jgi:ABC transport system ATP-binding/permease protein
VTNPVTEKARAVPKLQARTRRSGHTLHAGTEYRIGRDPDAGIFLDDPRVSWRHAILRAENGVWILEDSGSTNGTFRDSERITRLPILTPILIRPGNPEDGPLLRLDPVIPPLAAEVRPDVSQPVPVWIAGRK